MILAFSSLHIARLQPHESEREIYRRLAMYHYSISLPLFRANLPFITRENCDALYSTAHLMVTYLFALEDPRKLFFSPEQCSSTSNTFILLSGAYHLRKIFGEWIDASSIGCSPDISLDNRTRASTQNAWLERTFKEFVSTKLSHLNEHELKASYDALRKLTHLFSRAMETDREANIKCLCRAWLGQVSIEFFTRVRQRKPDALFVLSHLCIILREVENDFIWYMKGWSVSLLDECLRHIKDEWQPYFERPNALLQQQCAWHEQLGHDQSCHLQVPSRPARNLVIEEE